MHANAPGGRRDAAHRALLSRTPGIRGSLSTRTSRHSIVSASTSSRRPASDRADPGDELQRLRGLGRADDADQRREYAHASRSASPRIRRPRRTGSGSRDWPASRASNTAIWPSKRIAAPDTSGFLALTQARLTAWRVAKLSEQSTTTSAPATSGPSSRSPTRADDRGSTRTSGLTAASRALAASTLGRPTIVGVEQDLALQVGEIDSIRVDERERADAGRGEKLRHRDCRGRRHR